MVFQRELDGVVRNVSTIKHMKTERGRELSQGVITDPKGSGKTEPIISSILLILGRIGESGV